MQLFNIEGNLAKPTVEILLISPFKEIWERDTSPNKSDAIREFTYIEFMCSPKKTNPYAGYLSREVRHNKIVENIWKNEVAALGETEVWRPDTLVESALIVYFNFLEEASPSLSFLKSTRKSIEKLQAFFENFDMDKLNPKSGTPLYKPADITRALKEVPEVVKTLNLLEEKVRQELFESSKTKGNKEINIFETVQ